MQEEIARRKVLEVAKKQVEKEEEVEKIEVRKILLKEVKLQQHEAKLLEADEKLEVRQQERGEVTPPSSPSPRRATGRRSPGAKAKNFARLLHYQDRLEVELCLPPSRIKESMSEEEGRMTPGSSPRLRPARPRGLLGLGRNLEEEMKEIGAEALLNTSGGAPYLEASEAGCGGQEEDWEERETEEEADQSMRSAGGAWAAMSAPSTQTVSARSIENYSMRRQSENEGAGCGASTSTTSLVWWGQPYSNYWSSLTFCLGCQDRGLHPQW